MLPVIPRLEKEVCIIAMFSYLIFLIESLINSFIYFINFNSEYLLDYSIFIIENYLETLNFIVMNVSVIIIYVDRFFGSFLENDMQACCSPGNALLF